MSSLSRGLEELSRPADLAQGSTSTAASSATESFSPPPKAAGATGASQAMEGPTYTVTYAPTYEQKHALAKAADFDRRLVLLEKAIGISSTAVPGIDAAGLP